jgi:hypothetical protein
MSTGYANIKGKNALLLFHSLGSHKPATFRLDR